MVQFSPYIDDPKTFVYIDNVYVKEFGNVVHRHNKAQLIYAEGGIIHIFAENSHWYLPGRNYMWIPAGVPHYIISRSQHMSIFNFYFEVSEGDDAFYRELNVYMVSNMLREMILYTKNWNGPVSEAQARKVAFMKAIKAILPDMELTITTYPLKYPFPKNEGLKKIVNFLRENVESSFSQEEVASRFGYSSRTLSRLFKQDIGFSYVRYLRAIRLSKALELLVEGKYSINEIAMMVGYSSPAAFSNIFQRILGMRPSEFTARIKFPSARSGSSNPTQSEETATATADT